MPRQLLTGAVDRLLTGSVRQEPTLHPSMLIAPVPCSNTLAATVPWKGLRATVIGSSAGFSAVPQPAHWASGVAGAVMSHVLLNRQELGALNDRRSAAGFGSLTHHLAFCFDSLHQLINPFGHVTAKRAKRGPNGRRGDSGLTAYDEAK
jgi:hypothetical protein